MKITLSMETANAVIQYLSSKPYGEVYQLIALMRKDAAEFAEIGKGEDGGEALQKTEGDNLKEE